MTRRGSVSKMIARQLPEIDRMCKSTVKDSLEALKVLAISYTPRDTGKLAESWKTTPVTKTSRGEFTGRVYNDTSYAAPIEYGSQPHIIRPKNHAGVLANRRKGFGPVFGSVNHPGNPGFHMASKAALQFKHSGASRAIAEAKVREFLH